MQSKRPAQSASSGPATAAKAGEAPPDAGIPRVVSVAAAWAWRLLVIAALITLGWWLVTRLSTVTVPLMLAVLLTAALWPLKEAMVARKVPRGLAVALSLLLIAVIVVGIITLMGAQIASQWSELGTQAVNSFGQLLDWLATGPLGISGEQVDAWFDQAKEYVANQRSAIAGYIAAAGTQIGHFFAGIALALFATFYLSLIHI